MKVIRLVINPNKLVTGNNDMKVIRLVINPNKLVTGNNVINCLYYLVLLCSLFS